MVEPYALTVQRNAPVGGNTHIIRLEKPPGFSHLPGQFVVLQIEVDGKPTRRSYSIASAPQEPFIELCVKAQSHGFASPVICALTEGAQVGLLGPYGRFVVTGGDDPLLFIGAGTGVAPFTGYLRSLSATPSRPIRILASHRTPEAFLYDDVLRDAEERLGIEVERTITRPHLSQAEWDGLTGRIDKDMLSSVLFDGTQDVMVCGPTPMVSAVVGSLLEHGVPKDRIHTEKYGDISA